MASNGNVILWCASPAIKRSIRYFLRENAYTVVTCEHAEDVRIALSIDDYCLLVTDTPFPDSTLEQLLLRHPSLPVFHIAAHMPEIRPHPPHSIYLPSSCSISSMVGIEPLYSSGIRLDNSYAETPSG